MDNGYTVIKYQIASTYRLDYHEYDKYSEDILITETCYMGEPDILGIRCYNCSSLKTMKKGLAFIRKSKFKKYEAFMHDYDTNKIDYNEIVDKDYIINFLKVAIEGIKRMEKGYENNE